MAEIGLSSIPDLSELNGLIEIDLSFNQIKTTRDSQLPSNLQTLHLEGNPTTTISISPPNLDQLKTLYCGTNQSYCLDIPIVDRVRQGRFKLVLGEFSKSLLMPPAKVLREENETLLEEYVQSPERFVDEQESVNEKFKALEWLLCEGGKDFSSLDLSGMKWIVDNVRRLATIVDSALKSPFSAIRQLSEVNASNCNITDLKQIQCFDRIEKLNVSSNQITSIAGVKIQKLKELDVSDNAIEMIDFDSEAFTQLELITCGSESIKFVSKRVLNFCCTNGCRIDVSSPYQDKMLMPPWNVLRDKDSVREWIDATELRVSHIQSDTQKLEALRWVAVSGKKVYNSIDFSNEASFVQMAGSEMSILLSKPSFKRRD